MLDQTADMGRMSRTRRRALVSLSTLFILGLIAISCTNEPELIVDEALEIVTKIAEPWSLG
jgi:hypothetical protein